MGACHPVREPGPIGLAKAVERNAKQTVAFRQATVCLDATLKVEKAASPRKEGTAMVKLTLEGDALSMLFLVLALIRALRYR